MPVNHQRNKVGDDVKNVKKRKREVKLFKYFETRSSSRKKSENKPIIISPKLRKTRLKSEILIENMEAILLDGEYDISTVNFDSGQNQNLTTTKTPRKTMKMIVPAPAAKRSARLKPQALDRHYSNNLPECDKDTSATVTNVVLETLQDDNGANTVDGHSNKIGNNETPTKKRKFSTTLETAGEFIGSNNAAADKAALENLNISKRRRTNTETTINNGHIAPLENKTQTSTDKTNCGEAKNTEIRVLRKTENSIQTNNNIKNEKTSPKNANNCEKKKTNSIKDLNKSNTKVDHKNGILKYFKVQKEQLNEEAISKDQPEIKETVTQQSSELIPQNKSLKSTKQDGPRSSPRVPAQRNSKKKSACKRQSGGKLYGKISKLTKNEIKSASARKIPKDRLDDVLNMIDNDDHAIWQDSNTSCNPYIFNRVNKPSLHSDQHIKIKYARQFLLRRDWLGLSKILGLFNTTANLYYPLLAKYATLLLAHTDKEQFNKFIQFLTKINDNSTVVKACTKMPTGNDKEL